MDKYPFRLPQHLESSSESSLSSSVGFIGVNRLAQVQVLFLHLNTHFEHRKWCQTDEVCYCRHVCRRVTTTINMREFMRDMRRVMWMTVPSVW